MKFGVDRSFKTIELPLISEDDSIRVKAYDDKQNLAADIKQKLLTVDVKYEDDVYRVRSHLSMKDHGVRSSHWIRNASEADNDLQKFNQYRIKGTSNQGDSNWVYSNIKTDKNEEILFELIHDLIEVLDMTQDDKIEYIFDSLFEDLFINLTKKDEASMGKVYDNFYDVSAKISEAKKMIKTQTQKSFQENVVASLDYFSSLLRHYKIIDKFESEKEDFLALVIESFLEDQFENILNETGYEAIIKEDDSTHIIIQDLFNFDTQKSFISTLYSMDVEDLFIINVSDAVQIIREPEVFERLNVNSKEDYFNLFSIFLEDIYSPLYSLIEMTALISMEAEDFVESDFNDLTSGYQIRENDDISEVFILEDLLKILSHDKDDILSEMLVDLSETILSPKIEKKLSLWIDYAPLEFIEYIIDVAENSKIKNTSRENKFDEVLQTNMSEKSNLYKPFAYYDFKENIKVNINTIYNIIEKFEQNDIKEEVAFYLIDSYLLKSNTYSKLVEDIFPLFINDNIDLKDTSYDIYSDMLKKIFMIEESSVDLTSFFNEFNKNIKTGIAMDSESLYKANFKDLYGHTILKSMTEYNEWSLDQFMNDIYILDLQDEVGYILGDVGGSSSLGRFILGQSTLRGQNL